MSRPLPFETPPTSPMFDWRGHPMLALFDAQGGLHAFAAAPGNSTTEAEGTRGALRPGWWRGTTGQEERYSYQKDPGEYLAQWEDPVTRLELCWRRYHSEPVIKAACDLRFKPIAQAEWQVTAPEDATPTEERIAGWVGDVLTPHMARLVRWLLDAPRDGFAVVEARFDRVRGAIGPVEFEPRSALSIVKAYDKAWQRDPETGRIVAIGQSWEARQKSRDPQPMPASHVLHAIYDDDGRPDGNSLLRYVHRDADLLDQAMCFLALTLQRYAVPTPVIESPVGAPFDANVRARLTDALSRLRSSDKGGIPLDPGYSARLLGADGVAWDFAGAIRVYREGIAFAFGVPELLLGSAGGAGHRALAGEFIDVRMKTVEADARWLAAVLDDFITRLVRFNWGENDRPPTMEYGDLRSRTTSEINGNVVTLAGAGLVTRDEALEDHLRVINGLPEREVPDDVPVLPAVVEGAPGAAPPSLDVPEGADVQAAALNGAQVSAIVDIATKVATRELPRSSAIAIVTAAFPVTSEQAERMMPPEGSAMPAAAPAVPPQGLSAEALAVHLSAGRAAPEVPAEAMADCGHAHHFAARSVRLPRTVAAEAVCNFELIDEAQTEAVAAIAQAAAPFRARLAESLTGQLAKAVKAGVVDPSTIEAPADITAGLTRAYGKILDGAAKVGRTSVASELEQGGKLSARRLRRFAAKSDPATTDENAAALRAAQAQRLASRTVTPMVEAARDALPRLLRGGRRLTEVDPAVLAQIAGELDQRSLAEVEKAAAWAVPEVFALARASVADELVAEGERLVCFYSTMLDQNVCGPCGAVETYVEGEDGVEVGSAVEVAIQPPLQPNPVSGDGCEGANRCRCMKVYQLISKSEGA